jgi:hypothetical protein
MRSIRFLIPLLALTACGANDKIEVTDSGITADSASSDSGDTEDTDTEDTDTEDTDTEDTDTDTEDTDTDTEDTDTDTDTDEAGIDEDLIGSWTRRVKFDGQEIRIRWTFKEDGSCTIRMGGGGQGGDTLDCEFTATGTDFTITDEDCGRVLGVYTYVVAEKSLTFTLVEDSCDGRDEAIPGEWTAAQ